MVQPVLDFLKAHPNLAVLALLAAATGLWHAWDLSIRPLFVSRADIRRMAEALLARHGPRAEEIAFIEGDRAWRYADAYRQGVWRRVRRELRRGKVREDCNTPTCFFNGSELMRRDTCGLAYFRKEVEKPLP